MAEVTRKRTGELVSKLFDILKEYPDGLRAREALEKLSHSITLTEYEAGMYESSGTRRFDKIVRFATVDCVKAGWLVKHKGIWTLTEEGIAAHQKIKDPEAFYREAVRLYYQWKAAEKGVSPVSIDNQTENDIDVEDSSTITFEQAEEQALTEVERHLKNMNPYDFQELVADLLRGMGYFVSWVSPPGKDGGIDIIAHPDPLGTQSPRIKAQVKRYSDARIARPEIQSFISTIGDDDAGIFVCTSGFTKDSEEFARSQERRKIMLIDLQRFFDLWVQYYQKLDDTARRRFPITPIYFLTPEA